MEAYYRLKFMQIAPASWLTSRRLRVHGTALALCLWCVYLWTISTPGLRDRYGHLKGTDFLYFYTLGFVAAEHRGADLYNINAQAAIASRQVPAAAGIRYLPLYPPQVSLLFIPFTHFSYFTALALWWTFNVAIYAACCYAVWKDCLNLHAHAGLTILLAIAFPGFFNLIAWGQSSVLALAGFTAMFLLLRRRFEFAAGLALGCLIFKPQLAIAAAVIFLFDGAWKLLTGAALSAIAELGAGVLYYGFQPLKTWVHTLLRVQHVLPFLEPRPYQTHSLRTFWNMIVPGEFGFVLYLVSAVIVLALAVACWRRRSRPFALRYAALLFTTVLIAPHLTVYDLVILAPAFLLLSDWLLASPAGLFENWIGSLLYLVYVLPLLAPLVRWMHIQLSVPAMFGLLYCIWEAVRQPRPVQELTSISN